MSAKHQEVSEDRTRYLTLQRRARSLGLSLRTYRRCSPHDHAGGYTLQEKGELSMFCEQQRLSLDQAERRFEAAAA